jgi:hypothetical protein
MPVQGQLREVSAPQGAHGQKRDLQPVTIGTSVLANVLMETPLGILHERHAELHEIRRVLQPRSLSARHALLWQIVDEGPKV